MSRVLSVVLAVCCVLSMGIAGLPATDSPSSADGTPAAQSAGCTVDDPNVRCVENGSNYLSFNGSDVVTISENDTSLDVGSAVAVDVSSTSARLSRESVEAAYRATPFDERRAFLERFVGSLQNQTDDLRERERTALRRYNAGRIDGDEYLRTLAELDAKADRVWTVSRFVEPAWKETTGQQNRDPSATVRADLYGLRGPIRDRLQEVSVGERDSLTVHIHTTDSGFALGAFVISETRNRYVRDLFLGDVRRQSSGGDRYGGNSFEASKRIAELYPWATQDSDLQVGGDAGVYSSPKSHAHGSTTVFLDGQSGQVFAEHRTSNLDRIPIAYTSEVNVSSGLTVTLGRTHRGGPLNVTVTDVSGSRVPANVSVNGRSIGSTGSDGTRWTVTPYTARLFVTAEYQGETVTILRFAGN